MVVVGSSGVEGTAGGELLGGGGLGSKVLLGLRWLPIKIEQGEGFTGGREGSWWRDWRGGGPSGAGMVGAVAAQELPETGKKTSPGRLRAREAPLRWPEVACVWERAWGFLK